MRYSKKMTAIYFVAFLLVAAVAGYIFYTKSRYESASEPIHGSPIENSGMASMPSSFSNMNGVNVNLLPKTAPVPAEDSGMLLPTDILKGQSFLDVRQQIGYPESISGSLRNSNQQIRSEPENPRRPVSIFNNSTIVGDRNRRPFEIGGSY